MRSSVSLSVLAMIIAAPAFAGGTGEPAAEMVPVAVVVTEVPTGWAGGYVGANISFANGSLDAAGGLGDLMNENGYSSTIAEPSGTSGAIRGGYDWQNNQLVFGVGGEYNFGKYEGDLKGAFAEIADEEGLGGLTFGIEQMATIFGRVGYATNDQVMIYGLLGYTWANGTATLDGESESQNLDGLTLGLGGEYKFDRNWAAYGEYAYTNFGELENSEGLLEADINLIKFGVNYRF